ncbi:50S ribosomal protein L6 [uncultured bacterium]|nr:50S ribosomal protein L6 [uncultured bacterium]
MYNCMPNSDIKYFIINRNNEFKYQIINQNILTVLKGENYVDVPKLPQNLKYELDKDNNLYIVSCMDLSRNHRKIFMKKIITTYTKIINNAVNGLIKPFTKNLIILGVGYKFYDEQKEFNRIRVSIGYSTQLYVPVIKGVNIVIAKDSINMTIIGFNKDLVGIMASKFISLKKFNRYSMNGIKYLDQVINKKEINKKN